MSCRAESTEWLEKDAVKHIIHFHKKESSEKPIVLQG